MNYNELIFNINYVLIIHSKALATGYKTALQKYIKLHPHQERRRIPISNHHF